MKSRSIRIAVLSACIVTSPLLSFAAGQPKLHMLSKSQVQDLSGATRAVQQGKGAGMSRSQVALPSNANRGLSAAASPNRSDSAYRK